MKCDEPYEYTKATVTTASLVTAFVALFIGFASGFLTSRKCSKDGYRNCGHHYLENQNSLNVGKSSALHHTESGYTTAPCNNHIAASTTSSTSSNSTASSAVSSNSANNGSSNIITSDIISTSNIPPKNSNLLVNIQDKTEPEKNNLSLAADTSIIYNGTIPRNGTLCKKVYL